MYSIRVENLHKDFRIYERPQDRLLELLLRKPRHKNFHVLQDISFSVLEGRSLGIIGDNGAGKSTLMKLLVGTLQPSHGNVTIKGQVAALLELGAGFHPEFTGRRNIYLNAALLGVPDDNIPEMEQKIIEFSELGDFIDRPVKTYSSGMYVRLAFSIATMVNPDVLVIDEALSVGDIAFQKKCTERMNEFRKQNKTMIFCSHSMYHVQELCDTVIWLEKGRIRADANGRTSRAKVWAGGDCVAGGKDLTVASVEAGRDVLAILPTGALYPGRRGMRADHGAGCMGTERGLPPGTTVV